MTMIYQYQNRCQYQYQYHTYTHTHHWLTRTHHAIQLFASLGSRPQQLREGAAIDRRREGCNVREACDSGTSIFHTSCHPTRPRSIWGSKKYPLSTRQRTCVRSGESLCQTRVIGTGDRIFVAFTRWLWAEYQLRWKPGKPYLRLTEHTSYSDVTRRKSFWPHWPGNCEHAGWSASCKLRGEFNWILVFFRQYCGRGLTEAFEIITSPLWFCSVEWDQAHVMGLYQNVADFAGLQRWVALLVFEYVWRFSSIFFVLICSIQEATFLIVPIILGCNEAGQWAIALALLYNLFGNWFVSFPAVEWQLGTENSTSV